MPTLSRNTDRMEDEDLEDDEDEYEDTESPTPGRVQSGGSSRRPDSINKSLSKGQRSKARPGSSRGKETVEYCYLWDSVGKLMIT
jgi:hypothetical protein